MVDLPEGSWTLLGIFFAGLGLNLTPCVYPMLSVTISLFGTKREEHRGRAFFKAAVYVLGIVTMYSTLGSIAALTGGFFGVVLQHRWVLLTVSFLLLALALSLFGFYSLQVPSRILGKISTSRGAGLLGIYLSGLLIGIFAAPCIGPPIVALLTFVGTKGDPWFAFWVFFVMSLGLGAPYLVLGTFSGLLLRLPKSGVWMIWVERLFGVILVGLAAFYMVLALNPSWLRWLPPVMLVAGGLYLGFVERSGKDIRRFVQFKGIFGLALIAAGFAIPFLTPKGKLDWQLYTPDRFAAALETGRPMILDVYADWCIPCRELDQLTYTDPRVVSVLMGFERFKIDVTVQDSPAVMEAIERFDIVGVPTIIFLDAEGREVKDERATGFITARELLRILASPTLQNQFDPNH